MLSNILAGIVELRLFILISAVMALFLTFIFLIACHKFSWTGKKRKLFGLFYGMRVTDSLSLVCAFLKMTLFLAIVCDGGKFTWGHICVFSLLQLFSIVYRFNLRRLFPQLIETLVYGGVLLVIRILTDYLQEILYDRRIFVVVILLGVLLVMYAALDIVHCCNNIVTRDKGQVKEHETRSKVQ